MHNARIAGVPPAPETLVPRLFHLPVVASIAALLALAAAPSRAEPAAERLEPVAPSPAVTESATTSPGAPDAAATEAVGTEPAPPTPPAPTPPVPPAAETQEALEQRLTTCSIPREEEFLGLEWARRTSYRSVCLASHWFDGLFGDEAFDPKEGSINGYFAMVTEKRQDGGWETAPRLRTRIRLPQASKRFDLFFDRDKESQSIAGETAALRPEATLPGEGSTNQLGIGYDLARGVSDLLNLRLGLRLRSSGPELFVRSRYHATLADTGIGLWNLEQTFFWITHDGFGETTALEYQYHLGGPYVVRWQGSGTFSQQSDGLRWNSNLSLLHAIDADRALQWSFGGNGETGQFDPVAAYGPRVTYRQRLQRRWLILELYAGVDRVQTETIPDRTSQAYVGARIEAHFSPP